MKKGIIRKEQALWFFVIGAYFFLLYFMFYDQAKIIRLFTFGKAYTAEAIIGFGTTVKEEEIQTLLERYNAVPLSVSGFLLYNGIKIENKERESPSLFLSGIRATWIELSNKSLQSNREKIRHFLETSSEGYVVARNNPNGEARSMLFQHFFTEMEIVALKRGDPFIYSMEVVGDSIYLERLGQEKAVKVFELWIDHNKTFPFTYDGAQNIYKDPAYQAIQALSGQEVYQQLKALVTQEIKEDR